MVPINAPGRTSGSILSIGTPAAARISSDQTKLLHVENAHRVGRRGRGCPAASEPEAKIAMHIGDIGSAIQEMRLVLTQPDHPIKAGRDVDRLAGDRMDLLGAEARPEPAHLVHRPLVEPDDSRTDRLAVLAEEAEGLALVRDRHARDARRLDLCRDFAQRQRCRAPPVFGFLFEIVAGAAGRAGLRHALQPPARRSDPRQSPWWLWSTNRFR